MRKYLPTLADLIDRLSICLMKSIFIDRAAYQQEMKLIKEDIDGFLKVGGTGLTSDFVYAILVIMLSNRAIWENEATVRKEGVGFDRLRFTHSINGVRNRAKNEISSSFGQRIDNKIDCLAAELPEEFGNWKVFDE